MRTNPSRTVFVAVALVLVIGTVLFINRDAMTKLLAGPVTFTKAEVNVIHARGNHRNLIKKTVTVENAEELNELVKLFPELGTGKTTNAFSGWMAAVVIRFTSQDGTIYTVAVEGSYKRSTIQPPTGQGGEWEFNEPDKLEKFVEQLLKKKESGWAS